MKVFVDSSAFLAIIDRDDLAHKQADIIWSRILTQHSQLTTTNYVLVETNALIQRRLGMQFIQNFEDQVVPLLNVIWIDKASHHSGLTILRAANRRRLSLVDCVSFTVCQHLKITTVFAFDAHFSEQGFDVLTATL